MKTEDKQKIKISNATKDRVAACKAYIESNFLIQTCFRKILEVNLRGAREKGHMGAALSLYARIKLFQLRKRDNKEGNTKEGSRKLEKKVIRPLIIFKFVRR